MTFDTGEHIMVAAKQIRELQAEVKHLREAIQKAQRLIDEGSYTGARLELGKVEQ